MSKDDSLQAITADQPSQWEDQAQELLANIVDGQHHRKKRRTIIALADAAYGNRSQASVFTLASCASKVAHYKWREQDLAYEAAYQFLIGDSSMPGLARQLREQEIDEHESLAISALAEAKNVIRTASADAAYTLVDALQARTSHGPKWHERISAANSILDRSDAETATKVAPAISVIDHAIMKIYADDSMDDSPQAGLSEEPDSPKSLSDSETELSTGHPNNHDHDENNMNASTPDRDSKAALLALRSYQAKDGDDDNRSE